MQQQYLLSICIPTYQREAEVEACVRHILDHTDDRVQVVVSDDGSRDGTLRRLQAIRDPRLVVRRNAVNRAVAYNTYLSLWAGQGKYLLLISDEDDIITENLPALLRQLEAHPRLAGAIASGTLYRCEKNMPDAWYEDPLEFLFRHGFSVRYMSGMIFRRSVLHRQDRLLTKAEGDRLWNVYCFMYWMAVASVSGGVLTTSLPVYRQARQCYTSDTTNFRKEQYYFAPDGRLEQLQTWLEDIARFPLSQEQKWVLSERLCRNAIQMCLNAFEDSYRAGIRKEAAPAVYQDFLDKMEAFSPEQSIRDALNLLARWQQTVGCADAVSGAVTQYPAKIAALFAQRDSLLELYERVKAQRDGKDSMS